MVVSAFVVSEWAILVEPNSIDSAGPPNEQPLGVSACGTKRPCPHT